MLVSGVQQTRAKDGAVLDSVNVAAAYDPATRTWRKLAPPPGPTDAVSSHNAAWTGKEMLVWGAFSTMAFNARTNSWRRLPRGHGGLVVWTGRELIGWGGGCCGDAFSDGVAYNPAANTWRKLARSPLAGSQHPIGAWTGRELVMVVGGLDPDGRPWPAGLARAAAYNPATNSWRRIAPLPAARSGATAVWDGHELLVVGGSASASPGFAYDPAANRWRRLAPMKPGRSEAAAVWTGTRLLVWGGQTAGGATPSDALAYDPKANRWSTLAHAPLLGRLDPTAVWTGRALIVWGGQRAALPLGTGTKFFADGAAFSPGS
jgi:N-acetylneuraminic acid mutarotase